MSKRPAPELKPLMAEDLNLVLSWRNDPRIRLLMFSQHIISPKEHRKWFEEAVNDPLRKSFLFSLGKVPSGYVTFEINKENHTVGKWGFYKDPNAPRGSGMLLGRTSLAYAAHELSLRMIFAEILCANKNSIAFHLKLGFSLEPHPLGGFYGNVKYNTTVYMSKPLHSTQEELSKE